MVVVLALPGVGEGGEGEGGQHQAGQPGDHVGRPPAVAEDVSRGDVDTEDEGEAVAVVDSPAEDTVGDSSGGGGEHLSDERAADRSVEGNVKMLEVTELVYLQTASPIAINILRTTRCQYSVLRPIRRQAREKVAVPAARRMVLDSLE